MFAPKYVSAPFVLAILLLPALAAAEPVPLTSFVDSSVLWSTNGHSYAVVISPAISWDAAAQAAAAVSGSWHLATITSSAEEDFVGSLGLGGMEFWLGGFQSPLSTLGPDDNWTWVTGEPFTYSNWNRTTFREPNDVGGPGSEQYLGMWGSAAPNPYGAWNDEFYLPNISGYIVESAPVPEPSPFSLMLLGLASLGLARRRFATRIRAGAPRAL